MRVTPERGGSGTAGAAIDLAELANRRVAATRGPDSSVVLRVVPAELDGDFELATDAGERLRVRMSQGTGTFLDQVVAGNAVLDVSPPA